MTTVGDDLMAQIERVRRDLRAARHALGSGHGPGRQYDTANRDDRAKVRDQARRAREEAQALQEWSVGLLKKNTRKSDS